MEIPPPVRMHPQKRQPARAGSMWIATNNEGRPARVASSSSVDDDLEAAIDHPLGVEWHRLGVHAGDTLVLHDLRHDTVAVGARFVDDIGEDHGLVRLTLHA